MQVHGTVVADGAPSERGVLIIGPSGSGKSALALQLLAFGCRLVSDDLTALRADDGAVVATSAAPPLGIEARGVGILAAPVLRSARLALVVDLGSVETERLPPIRHITLCDVTLPVVHKFEAAHFPAAILQYIRYGRLS